MQGFSDSKVGKPLMVPGWARPVLPSSSVTGSGSITGSRPRIDTETLKLPKLNLRSMLMMVAVRELNSNEVSDKAHRTRFLGCSRGGLHTDPIRCPKDRFHRENVALQTIDAVNRGTGSEQDQGCQQDRWVDWIVSRRISIIVSEICNDFNGAADVRFSQGHMSCTTVTRGILGSL